MSSNKDPDLQDDIAKENDFEPVAGIEEAATGTADQPDIKVGSASFLRPAKWIAPVILVLGLAASLYVSAKVDVHWIEQKTTYGTYINAKGELAYTYKGEEALVEDPVPYGESPLRQEILSASREKPEMERQWVLETVREEGRERTQYSLLEAKFHFGFWSLLPAIIAIALCLVTKEALTALFSGVVVGAFMLGRFDITNAVLLPGIGSKSAAAIILLYLWLLGGLMGIWSRTGAAQAFAEFMTRHFVRGPKSAKFVSWLMGALFFQGGTISVVLVGTIVKPVADQQNVSHEELAYIVDSTASPIASVLAFNAWPIYVQAFLFVPGVAFLATEADRISFFFSSIPFSFYGILAVLGTLLLSFGVTRFAGPGIRAAHERAKKTGQLDAPGARPMSARELHVSRVPKGYRTHVLEFFIPITLLIGTAVGTFLFLGSPKVNWAFGIALLVSVVVALCKGMRLGDAIEGIGEGLKGVVFGSVILVLAVTIGSLSREIGAGSYLVEMLGDKIPYVVLPIALQLLTMIIAFSTGTSWGTYAIAFPLSMPLAWSVAQASDLSNPGLFMSVCFATVLNGSVYGDQCSPISDTTILSSMTTGCDLMDHVKTQIVPATYAAVLAGILWTATVMIFA